HRHGSEARTSRAVRSPGRRSLSAPGLERCHCLRLAGTCPPECESVASRNRRHPLFSRRALSCLAGLALSKRNLAWLCAGCGVLPLFGGTGLLAMGISGTEMLRRLGMPSVRRAIIEGADHRHRRLLCARRERLVGSRAAKKRDEIPPSQLSEVHLLP